MSNYTITTPLRLLLRGQRPPGVVFVGRVFKIPSEAYLFKAPSLKNGVDIIYNIIYILMFMSHHTSMK